MKDQHIIAHPTPDCQIIPSIALNTALAYAEKDWRVFPIKPGAKDAFDRTRL